MAKKKSKPGAKTSYVVVTLLQDCPANEIEDRAFLLTTSPEEIAKYVQGWMEDFEDCPEDPEGVLVRASELFLVLEIEGSDIRSIDLEDVVTVEGLGWQILAK